MNAGQKVAQLGHAIGTKIIRGACNFFAANILRIALLERHQSEDFGMRTAIPLTVLGAALACSLASAPAHARARVFVASYGNDANPCTFASFNRVEAYHNGGSWDRSVRHFFRGNVYGIATETTATFNGITGFYAVGGSFPGGEKFSNPFGRSRFNYLCRTLDGRKLE